MKKRFLLLVFLSVISFQIFGQFKIGFGPGVTISTVKFKNIGFDVPSKYRQGLTFSLPVFYQIKDKISIGLALNYNQKGYSLPIQNREDCAHNKINYVQFATEMGYKIVDNLFVGAGAYYALKTADYFRVGNEPWSNSGDMNIYHKKDYGLFPLLSYHYKSYSLTSRYLIGMTNIFNIVITNINGQIVPDVCVVNRSIEIIIAYNFKLN